MPHNSSAGWIARRARAAVQDELDALRAAVEALGARIETERNTQQAEISRLQEDLAQAAETRVHAARLQDEIGELRSAMAGLMGEIQQRGDRADAELRSLREAIAECDARIEAARVRLEGLITQHRWDVEQLRQAIAVLAEQRFATD